MDLSEKVEQLLMDEHIDQEAAIRLILLSQSQIIQKLNQLEPQIDQHNNYQTRYPSITWLLTHQRKTTTAIIAGLFAFFYLVSHFNIIPVIDILTVLLGF